MSKFGIEMIQDRMKFIKQQMDVLRTQLGEKESELNELKHDLIVLGVGVAPSELKVRNLKAEEPSKKEEGAVEHFKGRDIKRSVLVLLASVLQYVPKGDWFKVKQIKNHLKNMPIDDITIYLQYSVKTGWLEHNGKKCAGSKYRRIPQKEMTEEEKMRKIEEERKLLTER